MEIVVVEAVVVVVVFVAVVVLAVELTVGTEDGGRGKGKRGRRSELHSLHWLNPSLLTQQIFLLSLLKDPLV